MYLSSCNTPKMPSMGHGGEPSQRKGVLATNRWILFVLTTSLMLFFTLWLMFFHVSEDGLYYPIYLKNQEQIPENWVQRAIVYNTYDFNEYTPYKIINPGYEKVSRNIVSNTTVKERMLVCYYNFPPENISSPKILLPQDLDPFLCTHINLAFGNILNNSIYLSDFNLEVAKNVMKLKEDNEDLKVLLSVGGAGNSSDFPDMVINHENRKEFIKSILNLVKEHKFDGIDLDWEFPNRDGSKNDIQRVHFTQLLYEIRNEISRQEKHKFLLSLAVPAPIFLIDACYDVTYLNNYVDYVNLMSYDYHFYTKLTPFTGINAPLYTRENDLGYFLTLNINYTVHYWMLQGLARNKLVVGLPTYGHTFRLINVHNHGINAPADGYGTLGNGNGFVTYPEICAFLKRNQITPMFDLSTRSPFATKNHEWISFEDNQSLTFKAEFVKDQKFAGAMVYALNSDDHQMICESNGVKFPLTRRIKEVLNSNKKYYQY